MQHFITKEQLEKYDALKGKIIERIEEFPVQAENRIYAKFHEYTKREIVEKTPIDLVGSYFKLVSNGKYVIRDLYAVTYNGNPVKSIFISNFNVSLYANEDFSGLYADTLNSQTPYSWDIEETVEHFDYFVGNKEENTFVQLANYEQLEDFFIRKTEKGSAGGVATLDADGRIPIEQMNVKSLRLIGTYDCSSGVFPSTVNRVEGDYYRVSVGGTLTEMRSDIVIPQYEAISAFEANLINQAITSGLKIYVDVEDIKTEVLTVSTNKINLADDTEITLPRDIDTRLYADTEFPFSWDFDVNDLIVFNSQGEWQKLKSQDSVTSVNRKTGDVTVYGDNTPIETPAETSDTRTIKEYIEDTAVVRVDGISKDENNNINSIAVVDEKVLPSEPLDKVYRIRGKVYAKNTELVTEEGFDGHFEDDQWDAINSGITSEKIAGIYDAFSTIRESLSDIKDEVDDVQEDVESVVKANGTISNADLNNFKTAGMWRTISNVANLPPDMDSSFGQLLVMSGDDDSYPTQIFSVEGDDNNDLWYRKYDGETWGSWTKVITKNNFSYLNGTLTINM